MLKIAVVDDEIRYCNQIAGYIEEFKAKKGIEAETDLFYNGKELLEGCGKNYDIIFLDIEMPELDGMETARRIRLKDENVILVFITNMPQYAINGYEVGALDYALKPLTYYNFSIRLERAISRVAKKHTEEILLPTPDGMRLIMSGDIYYIEIQNHTLHYHTKYGAFSQRGTMQAAEKQMEGNSFAKCNHWYLVNLKHVSEIKKNIVVVAGEELEISRRNRTAFMSALTDYVGAGI